MKASIKVLFLLVAVLVIGNSFAKAQDVSEEMQSFMDRLDGSEEAAEAAMKMYANDEVLENGMIPFGKAPKVTSTIGECYHVTLDDEGDANEYVFCWEDGKIVSFDWADMIDDEDE